MKTKFMILAAAALGWPAPSAASAVDPTVRPGHSAPASLKTLDAELAGFGEWLVSFQQIQAPLGAELSALAPDWAKVDPSDSASVLAFKGRIARVTELADQTNIRLDALSTPEFPSLSLAEDLRPAAIRRDQIELNKQVKLLAAGFNPLLDGVANRDVAAAERGALQVIKGSALLINQQIRFVRAARATLPQESSSWDFTNIQLVLFRAMARLLAAFPTRLQPVVEDTKLAADLAGLADEVAESRQSGARKLAAEVVEIERNIARAHTDGAGAPLRIFQRQRAVLEVERDYGPFAEGLHQVLQQGAANLKKRPLMLGALVAHMRELAQVRVKLDAIIQKENEALAAPR